VIDLTVRPEPLERAVARARERHIMIPTFAQMRDPARVPPEIVDELRTVGLWDLDPRNLFRISWYNEPVETGGGFGAVNHLELPSELTGVDARIVVLIGTWFPTGAHKVGAAFGCLVPRLVTGQFDPTSERAVWPSTGNYCRGGAYDAALLGCDSIAILPEGMSRERFDWLEAIAGEVIRTPGSESNVKEIFDACWELRRSGRDVVIFNQFDEFGNYLWHHTVTGPAMQAVLDARLRPDDRYRGLVVSTGSAGTIAAGDHLKTLHPTSRVAAVEAVQCPTLLSAGYGSHRIEGIGDKHVPWIHNVRNTDVVIGVHDEAPLALMRLCNEPEGREELQRRGVPTAVIDRLPELGISGLANVVAAAKFARWYELGSHDVVLTVATDSVAMYTSRLGELTAERGPVTATDAAVAHERWLLGASLEHVHELDHWERKRVHNLKYFTWVEQQGKEVAELDAQWHDPGYWDAIPPLADTIDTLIDAFNARVGETGVGAQHARPAVASATRVTA
jgi:cysteine synthase